MQRITQMVPRYASIQNTVLKHVTAYIDSNLRELRRQSCRADRVGIAQSKYEAPGESFSPFCSGNNRNCWKPWRKLTQDSNTQEQPVLKRTAGSSMWVCNIVLSSKVLPNTTAAYPPPPTDVAETSFLSRCHPCVVRYHGNHVELGERPPGRPDGAAVPLPQKQETIRFASRHWHQERRPPRESGGTCKREGEG